MKRTVFVIVGPTSSGKTSLALELCKKYNGEIISADSRQIYKFMDIGTGKIPVTGQHGITRNPEYWTVDGVKIWGYDLATPDQSFTAFDYVTYATQKLTELLNENKTVFIVGGTGLYIDILTKRMPLNSTEPDLELRVELENKSLEDLQVQLNVLNPLAYTKVDIQNPIRLIRAIEKELLIDKPIKHIEFPQDVNYVFLGLKADNAFLYNRADLWVDEIWHNGFIKEVQDLIDLGYAKSPKLGGLIYTSALDFILGKTTEEFAIQRAKFDIHAYIRRQLTWFKRNTEINWFDISTQDKNKIQQAFETIYNNVNG